MNFNGECEWEAYDPPNPDWYRGRMFELEKDMDDRLWVLDIIRGFEELLWRETT